MVTITRSRSGDVFNTEIVVFHWHYLIVLFALSLLLSLWLLRRAYRKRTPRG